MENAIIRVIVDALDDDFWREDSEVLHEYYAEGNGEVDCEGFNIDIEDEETAKLIVGDNTFIIRVEKIN